MKRFRRLGILAGVLGGICVITVVIGGMEHKKELIRNTDEVILSVPIDSVSRLSWNTDTHQDGYAFNRTDEGWSYESDPEFPVDDEQINTLLSLFENLGAAFIIEEVEDYGQYGLEVPVGTIRLETGEDEHVITLGDFSTMDSQRYVSTGDGNVYLIQEDLLDDFDLNLSDLILHDNTPGFDEIKTINFSGKENYEIRFEENGPSYRDNDIYFAEKSDQLHPLDPDLVVGYLDTISWLDPKNYKTYKATEEDLEQYGLTDPELTITVDYLDHDEDDQEIPKTFVLHVSCDPEQAAQIDDESASGTNSSDEENDEEIIAYVRIGDSKIIYQIDEYDYNALMACSYNDLRHKEIIPAEYDSISRMDIQLEGETYTLIKQDTEDEEDPKFVYGDTEVDMTDIEYAMNNLKADTFTDNGPMDKEEISLTVYLNNDNDEQGIGITLYRQDGVTCLAEVNGEPVAYVLRSKVVDLIEAVRAAVLGPVESE